MRQTTPSPPPNPTPSKSPKPIRLAQLLRVRPTSHLSAISSLNKASCRRTTRPTAGPAYSTRDPGDLQLGVQALLIKEAGLVPTLPVGYVHRVRTGTAPDLDIGSFNQSALVLISGDVGEFHYDSNFVLNEQTADPVRRAQYGQTLSVTHDLFSEALHDRLEITGELWHFTQPLVTTTIHGSPNQRSNAVGTLWTLGYAVRPNLILDVGFDHGLTSTSTAWQTFGGFTYLIPHRLWPHRTPPALPAGPLKHVHRR
ncbi:MAG: hypothetical protein JWM43_1410 [Acidobacteriaceae bacterium]|nr:hypothetical protein [Acidobacteriaceae bacterium]